MPFIGRFVTDPNIPEHPGNGLPLRQDLLLHLLLHVDPVDHPRFRYDQLMNLGWKNLIPLAIANIFITGLVMWLTGKSLNSTNP